MADDERRAEIEAMPSSVWLCPRPAHYHEWYVPHGGICPEPDCGETLVEYRRSPQGEDHERLCDDEALVQRAARALARCSPPALDLPWDDLPAADRAPYEDAAIAVLMELGDALSRVSPSRDGTVAVEDVERWMTNLLTRFTALDVEWVRQEFRREFARPATGEQIDHGGNQ